jgi:ferritin-like metal-binding protein YciE
MVTEVLIAWLNDAYTMEQTQTHVLEQLSIDFERYPEIQSEIRQHLAETHKQLTDLQECIESLGGVVTESTITGLATGGVNDSAEGGPYNDELVKHMLLLHANERFEQGTYIAIAEAAHSIDEDEIADTCERIAEEECAMAEWTEEQIPLITAAYMASTREEV